MSPSPRFSRVLLTTSLLLGQACTAMAASQDTAPTPALPTGAEIDTMMRGLSEITGFRIHRRLPFSMVTRQQVNQFLKDQIRRSVKPKEIRAEEATLRMFGFVPKDFDLRQTTIDLLTEQAAAYYDFQRRKLFISDWANRNMREVALVHELAHALADQNFPIRKYLAGAGSDAEASLARQSVVEGQASWLMLEYAARQAGRSLKDPATAAELLRAQTDQSPADGGDTQYPVFSKAPLYIRKTLMFPYDEGQKLQQTLYLSEGQSSFARLFRQPPASSSEILHPERYLRGPLATVPRLPKRLHGTDELVSGTVGELDHRILLRQYVDQITSETLSPLLKGGAFRIDETKHNHHLLLTYVSEWENADAASKYFAAYRQVLRGKWKKVEGGTETSNRFSGHSEDGYFLVTLDGTQVLSREGASNPL